MFLRRRRWRSCHLCDASPTPASLPAEFVANHSLFRDFSTDTWSVTATRSDISALSVARDSTILSIWRDTQELIQVKSNFLLKKHTFQQSYFVGVRPYKCNLCEKSFTQRCSLESHCLKVHGVNHSYEYKQRRSKVTYIIQIKAVAWKVEAFACAYI